MSDARLDCDLDELIGVFGVPLPLSSEERGEYWFGYDRPDGVSVTLHLSLLNRAVGVIVHCSPELEAASARLEGCTVVRVLEPNRKTVEIATAASDERPLRCFLALDGDSVMHVGPLEEE